MRAVVFIIVFANLALQASPDLCTDANAVSYLAERYLWPSLDDLADDFVSDAERKFLSSPAAGNRVEIACVKRRKSTLGECESGRGRRRTSADTASLDDDIDIVVLEGLWLELDAETTAALVKGNNIDRR